MLKTGVATASTIGIAKMILKIQWLTNQAFMKVLKTESQHHIDNQTESNHDEDHDITSESVESVKHAPKVTI